jgi:hypothetical protein
LPKGNKPQFKKGVIIMTNFPNLTNLHAVLTANFPNGVQIFDSRNTVGDTTKTIYLDGRIQVEYSADNGYIEVLGAYFDEYDEIYAQHHGKCWDAMDKKIPTTVVVF